MSEKFNKYTKETKLKTVKRYLEDGLSYQDVAIEMGIKSKTQVKRWVKKFNDLGSEVLPEILVQGKKANYPVKVSHDLFDVVQTNAGGVLQLGERPNNLFGSISTSVVSQFNLSAYPSKFGTFTQKREIDSTFNEMETITDVWLEIPFFTNRNDADNDGLGNNMDTDDDNDGLSDLEELAIGCDPLSDDSAILLASSIMALVRPKSLA